MVDQLDPSAMLAAYRAETGPPPGVEARMLASMQVQLGLPPSSGQGASAGTTTTATAAAAGTAKLIAGLALVLTTALGVGAAVLGHPGAEPRVAGANEHRAASAEALDEPAPVADELDGAPASLAPLASDLELEPEPEPSPSPSPSPKLRSDGPKPTANSGRGPSLADEAKLLREADEALRRGDLGGARASLDSYARQFAGGRLGGQARVLDLLLGCASDLPGAREAAAHHLDAHPNDRAHARLTTQCGAD